MEFKRRSIKMAIISNLRNGVTTIPGKLGDVILLSGHNIVQDDKWDACKHNLTGNYLEQFIRVIGPVKTIKKKVKEKDDKGIETLIERDVSIYTDLNGLDTNEAVRIVQDTYSTETLKKWQKKAKETELRNVIADRLKFIMAPDKK